MPTLNKGIGKLRGSNNYSINLIISGISNAKDFTNSGNNSAANIGGVGVLIEA